MFVPHAKEDEIVTLESWSYAPALTLSKKKKKKEFQIYLSIYILWG